MQNEVSEDQIPECPLEHIHEDTLEAFPLLEGEPQPLARRPNTRSAHQRVPRQLTTVQLEGVHQDALYLALAELLRAVGKACFEVQRNVLGEGCQASLFVLEGESVVLTVDYLHLGHHKVVP